jgi:dCMP deaminase
LSRPTKTQYYLDIAGVVAERSSCSRRKFGAIIVKDDMIISSGYNGSARGTHNCGTEEMPCLKDLENEEHSTSYNFCPAVHAEQNAIIQADSIRRWGATMYLSPAGDAKGDSPCFMCRRFIIQSGIKEIYYLDKERKITLENVSAWIKMENLWMEVIRDRKNNV